MKKTRIIKIITLLTVVMFIILNNTVFAFGFGFGIDTDNIKDDYTGLTTGDQIKDLGSLIYSIITNIAIIVSVIVIAVLGIKYMMGSVEERAGYKKSMLPYLVGAVFVFGATTITKMVMDIVG